jgi:hypothetical protein
LKRKIAITVGAGWILAACGTGGRETENHASSSSAGAVNSVNAANRVSVDSAHGAPAALVPLSSEDAAQVAAASSDTIGLRCMPSVFSRSDTITLRMENPHGEYLMVSQPDSTPFFLSYPDSTEPRNFFLVAADSFAQMPVIRFRAGVRSRPRIYGRDTLESVFTKPGKYVLTIGHKLETEHASGIHRCTIRLVSR